MPVVETVKPVRQPEPIAEQTPQITEQPVAEPIYENKEEQPPSYVEPTPEPVQKAVLSQPDIIPVQRASNQPEIIETLPPPDAFSNANGATAAEEQNDHDDQIYSNVNPPEENIYSNVGENEPQAPKSDVNGQQMTNSGALVGNEDCDLSEYIEDTKIRAIALYDYQAQAEDEISFDPNDIISHIEQVTFYDEKLSGKNIRDTKNSRIFSLISLFFTIYRSTKVGGVDFVKTDTAYSQQIMFNLKDNNSNNRL